MNEKNERTNELYCVVAIIIVVVVVKEEEVDSIFLFCVIACWPQSLLNDSFFTI